MTHKIQEAKERIIDDLLEDLRVKGINQMNAGQTGQICDMIKDLAEAEHHCWEACYYKSVVEAMDEGNGDRMGYYGPNGSGVGSNAPMGYNATGRNQYSNGNGSMGYTERMGMNRSGFSDQSIENIKMMMEQADPTRKKQLLEDMERLMREMR